MNTAASDRFLFFSAIGASELSAKSDNESVENIEENFGKLKCREFDAEDLDSVEDILTF